MGFPALIQVIDTPMFVVTASSDGEKSGCLVGFATQASINPMCFIVCVSRTNHTHRVAERAARLGVHLLSRSQRNLAELFGTETGDEIDKFARCRWEAGPGGTPMLLDCPNRFVGTVRERLDVGDHTAFVLDVVETGPGDPDVQPLMFQEVRDLEPGHRA